MIADRPTDPLTNSNPNPKHHNKNTDVDLSKVAQLTPGLAGADLASLVNEAAIRAVRRGSAESVTMFDMDMAVKDYFRSRGTGKGGAWVWLGGCCFVFGGGERGVCCVVLGMLGVVGVEEEVFLTPPPTC